MTEDSILDVDNLSGFEFQELIAKIMKKIGYSDIRVQRRTGDFGKDILMWYEKNGSKYPVVVECKHQKFVGRPIIQKLQGAMLDEKKDYKFIKGIVVTSGEFSSTVKEYVESVNRQYEDKMEIELIDGRKLKKLCEDFEIIILNGKIQIKTNNVVKHVNTDEMKDIIKKDYSTIIGAKKEFLKSKVSLSFHPYYYIKFRVDSQTYTTVGCVYDVKQNDKIVIDGEAGGELHDPCTHHFFSTFPEIEEIEPTMKKFIIPFEFTETDIEKEAINKIISRYTREVTYTGENNVTYTKICKPKSMDIDIITAIPMFIPILKNNIRILSNDYIQEALSNYKNILYLKNQLHECRICGKDLFSSHGDRYLCPICGKILCLKHKKLDAYDKTPVCQEHAVAKKLFLQKVYFVSKSNLEKYNEIWNNKNILQKIRTDRVLSFLIAVFIVIIYLIVYSLLT